MAETTHEGETENIVLPIEDTDVDKTLEIEFFNAIQRGKFEKTALSKRVLFLPHCLRRMSVCKGTYDIEGFNCVYCSKCCPIYRLRTFAEVLGYRVLIAPGVSIIEKFIEQMHPNGVVAVACYDELVSCLSMIRRVRPQIATQVVSLSRTGCSNTEVCIEKVKEILKIPPI
ncbi:MAG: DUF116 domain-containing protein [Halobacteriota archaeon]|nr:DUF116 domain-containing protein [Halobacteriota archaeon]